MADLGENLNQEEVGGESNRRRIVSLGNSRPEIIPNRRKPGLWQT